MPKPSLIKKNNNAEPRIKQQSLRGFHVWFIVFFLPMNLLLMRSCLTCMPVLHGAGTGTSPSGSSSSGMSGIGKRYIMQMSWRIKARVIIVHALSGVYWSTPPERSIHPNLDFTTPMHLSTTLRVFRCARVALTWLCCRVKDGCHQPWP